MAEAGVFAELALPLGLARLALLLAAAFSSSMLPAIEPLAVELQEAVDFIESLCVVDRG